jgi:hypothetical protein
MWEFGKDIHISGRRNHICSGVFWALGRSDYGQTKVTVSKKA